MAYQLPQDVHQRVQAQIATGAYQTEEEVLREAIESLEYRQRGLAELQAMIREAEEDVAAGHVGEFDRDKIKSDIRDRLAKRGITD